jgi:glycosyltransferase involved in cell wall biosynthesis
MRTRMGASGRQRVTNHFDWDASAARAVDIYRRVLAG